MVAGITYDEAWKDLEAVGRTPKRGVHFHAVLPTLMAMRGKRATDVTEEYRRKGVKTAITAARVLPKRGAFIIFMKRHVGAYRAGELHDWTAGRRKRVLRIIRINADTVPAPVEYDAELGLSIDPRTGGVLKIAA